MVEYGRGRRASAQGFGISEAQRNKDMELLSFKLAHMKASIDNAPPRSYVAPPPAVRDRLDPREKQRRRSLSPALGGKQQSRTSPHGKERRVVNRPKPCKPSVVSRSKKYKMNREETGVYSNFVRLLTSFDDDDAMAILNDVQIDAQESRLLASYTGVDSAVRTNMPAPIY